MCWISWVRHHFWPLESAHLWRPWRSSVMFSVRPILTRRISAYFLLINSNQAKRSAPQLLHRRLLRAPSQYRSTSFGLVWHWILVVWRYPYSKAIRTQTVFPLAFLYEQNNWLGEIGFSVNICSLTIPSTMSIHPVMILLRWKCMHLSRSRLIEAEKWHFHLRSHMLNENQNSH